MEPRGFWEVKAPGIRDIGTLRTGRLYPQEDPGTQF
jgi:hypothetical protein